MSISAFSLNTVSPSTPTFSDVRPGDFYYQWIEGGVAASIIAASDTYRPLDQTTRAEASRIVAAYLVQKEVVAGASSFGRLATYSSLSAWYKAEGSAVLQYFKDKGDLTETAAPYVAYLVYHKVVQGVARGGRLYLDSTSNLTPGPSRGLHSEGEGHGIESVAKSAPKITAVGPIQGPEAGGNTVVITGPPSGGRSRYRSEAQPSTRTI